MPKGYWKESYKHALNARGIRSKTESTKLFERLDTKSLIKTQTQAEINYILYKTKLKYGTTNDIEKAYFLLPTGEFISYKEFCGAMHDKIDVEGVRGEFRFNYITGTMSIVPTGDKNDKIYVRIYSKPSKKQMDMLKDIIQTHDITVDLIDCVEEGSTLFCHAEAAFELNNNFSLGKINRYFNSEIKGCGYEEVMTELFGTN
jgi:hypothetical protein